MIDFLGVGGRAFRDESNAFHRSTFTIESRSTFRFETDVETETDVGKPNLEDRFFAE